MILRSLQARVLAASIGTVFLTTSALIFLVQRGTHESVLTIQDENARNLQRSLHMTIDAAYQSIIYHKQNSLKKEKEVLRDVTGLAYEIVQEHYEHYKFGGISDQDAQQQAMSTLRRMRYRGDVGYIWISDLSEPLPKVLMHPILPELEGKELTDKRYFCALGKNEHLFKAFADVCRAKGEGFVDYLWPKPTAHGITEDREKLSYVRLFKPWGWIIGSGVYIDDIERAQAERVQAVIKELAETSSKFRIGESGYVFILDGKTKKALVHPTIVGQEVDSISGPMNFRQLVNLLIAAAHEQGSVVEYDWNKPGYPLKTPFRKRVYMFYFEPLDWYIGVSFYLDDLEKPTLRLRNRMIVLSCALLGLAILSAAFLSNSLSTPLKRLAEAARRIRNEGSLSVEIPVGGSIETQELGKAMGEMMDSIASAQEQLHHTQKMNSLGRLAGGIAHDFNNILGGIQGAAQVLTDQTETNDPRMKFVRIIDEASSRATDLTNKLLAFSRKGKFLSSAVDLHSVIKETVELLRRTIDKSISIETRLEAHHHVVLGDRSQLQNLFLNLAVNARDAMPHGGTISLKTREVTLDQAYCEKSHFAVRPGPHIEIKVKDSGLGISSEHRDQIFEPFFTTKPEGEGTGLGLAAVYASVEEHHGEIFVKSELGKGCEFCINLPVKEDAAVEERNVVDDRSPTGTGTILLVDDEEILRTTAHALIESLGYSVLSARDGYEAVEIYKSEKDKIRAVVLDLIMPRMGGRDAFHRIRKVDPNARVIISSGFNREQSIDQLIEEGAADFIQKPYRRAQIAKVIAKVLA